MGYITDFEVDISNVESEGQASEIVNLLGISYYDFRKNHLSFYITSKWYEWEKELKSVSKNYPNVLIEVFGKGEESEDMWKARFRNGISEIVRARIVFDDFKEIL